MTNPPTPDPTLPDPSIYTFHGLATEVDARRRGVRQWVLAGMLALGFVLGATLGFVIGTGDDTPCTAGQVYVVDIHTCADASDHSAHEGHTP